MMNWIPLEPINSSNRTHVEFILLLLFFFFFSSTSIEQKARAQWQTLMRNNSIHSFTAGAEVLLPNSCDSLPALVASSAAVIEPAPRQSAVTIVQPVPVPAKPAPVVAVTATSSAATSKPAQPSPVATVSSPAAVDSIPVSSSLL